MDHPRKFSASYFRHSTYACVCAWGEEGRACRPVPNGSSGRKTRTLRHFLSSSTDNRETGVTADRLEGDHHYTPSHQQQPNSKETVGGERERETRPSFRAAVPARSSLSGGNNFAHSRELVSLMVFSSHFTL